MTALDAKWRGIHAVLYAMFDASEQLDRAAMRRQVDVCFGAGVAGITALGLATEVAKLTMHEREQLIGWVAEDVAGRAPLGITITGQSVAEQSAMVRAAEGAGADWLILQPPAAGSFATAEYLEFFSRVIDRTTLPVAIQNAPQYLGRGLTANDVAALITRHPSMTLIKAEGSAIEVAALIERTGNRLAVLNGRGGLELPDVLQAGASGFILAPDAIDHAVHAMQAFSSGDTAKTLRAHARAAPSINFVMQSIETLICYGKRLFALRAGLKVHDRAPALRPTPFGLKCVERHAAVLGPYPEGE